MNEFQSTQSDQQNLSFSTIQGVLSLLPDFRCPNLAKTGFKLVRTTVVRPTHRAFGHSQNKQKKLDRKWTGSRFESNSKVKF